MHMTLTRNYSRLGYSLPRARVADRRIRRRQCVRVLIRRRNRGLGFGGKLGTHAKLKLSAAIETKQKNDGMIDIRDRMRRWRQNWLIFVPYSTQRKRKGTKTDCESIFSRHPLSSVTHCNSYYVKPMVIHSWIAATS